MTGPQGALAGLKVVEFAHLIAGPLAGGFLADLGADVVHVETPGTGDAARKMGPPKGDVYLWWKIAGRNKRSVTLDIRQPAGRTVARRLAAWADVVITNLRPTTMAEWELDFESLHSVNPKLVYCQISGFGAVGSLASAPGFGKAGEAMSGVVQLTGEADGAPLHSGFSHGDSVTGLMGAFSIMAALHRRHEPGFQGEWIDLALFESLFRLIEWQVVVYDQLGMVPARQGNRMAISPAAIVNAYRTSEGDWITVTSATPRSVEVIIRLLGLPFEDYATREQQRAKANAIDAAIAEWMRQRTTRECIEQLVAAEVVASPIYTAKDIVESPIYKEREDIITIEDPDLGPMRQQAVVPKLRVNPGQVWRTGAPLGADNDLVFGQWLGFSPEELESLKRDGIV